MKAYIALAAAALLAPTSLQSAGPAKGACTIATLKVQEIPAKSLTDMHISLTDAGRKLVVLDKIFKIGETCAHSALAAASNQLLIDGSDVLEFSGANPNVSRPYDQSLFALAEPAADAPTLAGMRPIASYKLHEDRSTGSTRKLYVGLWHRGGQSIVATFRQGGGAVSKPVPLLTSKSSISGLGYFPSVDSNTGLMSLVAHSGDKATIIQLHLSTSEWRKSGSPI